MLRAREMMNAGLWREATSELERVVHAARSRRAGHAEALWALAVCHDALGRTAAALEALDASIAMDPTALTSHETRTVLTERLRERAADGSLPLEDRRAASELLDRHREPRGKQHAALLSRSDRLVLRMLLDP